MDREGGFPNTPSILFSCIYLKSTVIHHCITTLRLISCKGEEKEIINRKTEKSPAPENVGKIEISVPYADHLLLLRCIA